MSLLDGSQCVSVPPSWLEKPSNQEVTLGQKVELPCRADGAPLPKITWKKEIGKRNKTLTMMRLIKVQRSSSRTFLKDIFACKKMKYATKPTVSAVAGLAIGGGFEVACQTSKMVAHMNSTLGLVETGVGLVPGGGGCKELLWRWRI